MTEPAPCRETLTRLKDLMRRELKLAADEEIADDMPLLGGRLDLDSLDVLLLLTRMEKEFGFKLSDENEGRDSAEFVAKAMNLARAAGVQPVHVSAVVLLERPKLGPHRDAIRDNLAKLLDMDRDRIAVAAKSGEGLGPVGEGLAVEVRAVVTLEEVQT